MSSNVVSRAFNSLLASGRSCAMQGIAVRILRDSALSLTEGARTFLQDIYGDLFSPTMREDAIVQWEKQFGLEPGQGSTLAQRMAAIEIAWGMSGAQGKGYIQKQLNDAGFDVVVTNNIPIADLLSDTMITMGEEPDPGGSISMTEEATGIGMGEGFDGYLFGNGFLLHESGGYIDPIETPTAAGPGIAPTCTETDTSMTETDSSIGGGINDWAYVFIIEGAAGAFATVPAGLRSKFEKMVLKLKPAHLGVLMKVTYT